MSESFEEIYDRIYPQLHNPCGLWKAATIMEWLDDLITAHNHELEQARDPQRIGGRFERDSFEYAIEQLREFRWQHATNDEDAIPYINGVARAHEHEIEHIRKAEYHRGHEDGKKSMDAEHYAVALKLRRIRFDGDSHANLSKIAYAVYPCATGWTCESCDGLRDKLIELLGGVHDEPVPMDASCGAGCADCDCGAGESGRVTYDELGNERHEAVCALRKMTIDSHYYDNYQRIALAIGAAYDGKRFASECVRDRLIHLLGGDEPDSQKSPILTDSDSEDGNEVTITDELREWYRTTPYLGKGSFELCAIADRIDEQEHKLRKQRDGFRRGMVAAQDLLEKRTDERDKLRKSLRKIAEHVGVQHDLELSTYDDDTVAKATIQLVGMMHKHIKTLVEKLDTIREALDG